MFSYKALPLPPSWGGQGPPSPPLGSCSSVPMYDTVVPFFWKPPSNPCDGSSSDPQAGSPASTPWSHVPHPGSGCGWPLWPGASPQPLPSPERSPPSSSFPSWVPLFSSFAFSLVCNYIDYCNVFTYLCFCSPVQPLVLPRNSSKSFVSVTPLRASSSPRACPAYTAALDGTPKLPQKMSASCLTSLKRPFIPSPPAPASLRDGSRDSRVPGPWVRFPPCHFLAVFSGSVVIPLRTSSFRPGWGEHLPAAA